MWDAGTSCSTSLAKAAWDECIARSTDSPGAMSRSSVSRSEGRAGNARERTRPRAPREPRMMRADEQAPGVVAGI
jgi:hypothetical protein